MENLVGGDEVDARVKASLGFALARVFDRQGRFDDAFRHLHRANDLIDGEFSYDADEEEERFAERTMAVFTPELFRDKAGVGADSERPVFIVGMPRSGTTLVEVAVGMRIAAHPPRRSGHGR